MHHTVETQWIGGMEFHADVNGHTLVLDAPERAGGQDAGPIPKPLVLTALAGCTGMDIAALLRKAGKLPESFSLKVTGEISQRPPIVYTAAHIVYAFEGPAANRDAALEAVARSQGELCGVSHMLKKIMPVTWDVVYNGEAVSSGATSLIDNPETALVAQAAA